MSSVIHKHHIQRWHKIAILLCACDFVLVWLAYAAALYFRFDCNLSSISKRWMDTFLLTAPFHAGFAVFLYSGLQLYNRVWRFVGYRELFRCIIAGLFSVLLYWFALATFDPRLRMPLSYHVFGGLFQMMFLVGTRFSWRFVNLLISRSYRRKDGAAEAAMLIGGGSAGQLILRDLSTTAQRNIRFKCIIDDDERKWGCAIEDVPVVGGRDDIRAAVTKYNISKIFIAIPRATEVERRDILNICKETGCEVKVLPGLYQFTDDEVSLAQMREVSVEDLLGRKPVDVNREEIMTFLTYRVVLVTGGGGSVGTELCLQIAACRPKQLIIFDIYENNAYYVQQYIHRHHPEIDLVILVGSVRDSLRVDQIFADYHPDVVFHAAAHKHLPLMEASPCEAIKNNVIGTYKTAYAALKHGCRRFILLSTDKAVNPTSILGASSRLCEMLMQTMEHLSRTAQLNRLFAPSRNCNDALLLSDKCQTEFSAVRFGNVFDSDGSVFKLFQQQIRDGGPVLVTHRDVTRFCMSRVEVVSLILQAASYARDGEVFVLDMGEPYRIDDLARNLIRLYGFIPDETIKIQYTGLRPGEKLCEEPLMWEEGMRKTAHPRIYVANPTRIDLDGFLQNLHEFFEAAVHNDPNIKERISAVVNSYHVAQSEAEQRKSYLIIKQTPINNLELIAEQFAIAGSVVSINPMTKGYINRTYCVDTVGEDGKSHKYTLQRINDKVFADVPALMENFDRVTKHLAQHYRLRGDDGISNQLLIPLKDGGRYSHDTTGCWRMLTYFSNVHSYDIPDSPKVFYESGRVFGSFTRAMASMDAASLNEVIPNFHNTWSRYQDLEAAIAADPVGRVASVKDEIEFVRQHKDLFKMMTDALGKGELPLRIGHNDCNLNNVLFDDDTNEPVAIIDLDTVMPSTPLYDFGDSMRIGTNTARDDEKDLTKVKCNLELFEQYARGWLEACGKMLVKRELELLPYAALVITSEDGIRFLMDHINGDTYYYIYYLGQNLDRARTQFKLLADMEEKLPQIKDIINRICVELGI